MYKFSSIYQLDRYLKLNLEVKVTLQLLSNKMEKRKLLLWNNFPDNIGLNQGIVMKRSDLHGIVMMCSDHCNEDMIHNGNIATPPIEARFWSIRWGKRSWAQLFYSSSTKKYYT